jgi:hypothetical protein
MESDYGKGSMMDEQTLKLHYIDKAHAAWLDLRKAWNRTILWCVLMSFLVLGLASGVTAADGKLSLVGMELRFPSWLVPFSCGWVLTLLYAQFWGLVVHDVKIQETIERLYSEVGFSDPTLEAAHLSVLAIPDLLGTLASEQNLRLGFATGPIGVLVAGAVTLLPLIALGVLCYALLSSVGLTWWLIASLALMTALMTVYAVAGIRTAAAR